MRDPRINPMPGDVMRRGKTYRLVQTVDGGWGAAVGCKEQKPGYVRTVAPFLSQWRKWAARAEIVKVAE